MIVTCEACFTSFKVNDALIKPSGSKVQCSKCRKVFIAYPPIPEDIEPPPLIELSDPSPEFSLSSSPFKTQLLDPTGDTNVLPVEFKDITEFDFSELDQLLQENGKDTSENAFSDIQTRLPHGSVSSSDDASQALDFSEKSDNLIEPDFSDISLDLPEVKALEDISGADFTTTDLFETENADQREAKGDEALEQALSEISFDESFEGAVDQLETQTKPERSASEPQDFSLDDFEKSLEMDFSDITLVASADQETVADRKSVSAKTETPDQKPEEPEFSEDVLIDFDNIEALDISDIEGLLENKEISVDALNAGDENFHRAEAITVPPSPSSTEAEQTLEMDEQYLTFDELQLDMDDAKPATLQEVKESFKPPLPEIPIPPSAPSAQQPKPFSLETASKDKEMDISTDAGNDDDMEDTTPVPKKGISPAVWIALILAVVAAAGYGGYMLLNSMGISIPFISTPAPSKATDPGNINIKSLDITSKFVENSKIGKLFVITGKVKNEYPVARGSIQISGKIYTKEKTLAKTETVFCGNILSDADLANADATTIQHRLQNKSGDNHSNQKVLPGATIPFMIVFSNLPVNLEEFTTEVTSSNAL